MAKIEKTFLLGKVAQPGHRGLCDVEIDVRWDGKSFAASAAIWLPSRRDIICGGQNLEEACGYFPDNQLAQRILAVWREWHLNDLTAGSPAQEAWLKANPIEAKYPESHYDKASKALAEAGLNPDPNYQHDGKPYKYGHAWLTREIPADVAAEIESWLQ